MARFFQYQNKTEPVTVPTVAAAVVAVVVATTDIFFPKSFIYQSKVEPLFVGETITVDKWHEPLSQPLFKKTSPTNQQTLAFQFPIPEVPIGGIPVNLEGPPGSFRLFQYQTNTYVPVSETSTVDKWLKPLNEPPKTKKLPTSQQQALAWSTFTPAPPVVATSAVSSQVTFKSRLIYQSEAYVQVVTTETITVDKWFEAFSEPVRTRKLPTAEQQSFTTGYLPDPSKFIEGWYRPFSDPVRIKPKVCFQQDLAWSTFTPTAVTATFAEAFSSGVVFPKSIIYQSLAWAPQTITAPTVTYFKMVEGDTGLTFQKTIIYQINAEALSPDVPAQWLEPLREPYLKKRGLAANQQQALAWSTFTPTAAVTAVIDKTETSQVVFPKSIIYQSLAWNPFTPPSEAIFEDKWHRPWSEPVRLKKGLRAEEQQVLAWSGFTPAFTEPRWYEPLSEPVRTRRFPTSEQQALAWNTFTPAAINEDKWHYPWSVPVRQKAGLSTGLQQSFTWSNFTPQFTEPRWYQPLSEPVRTRKLPTSEQQVLAWSTFTPAAVVNIPVFGSFSGTIYKSRLIYQSDTAPFFIPAFTDVRWYRPLSEPVRLKKGLGAPYQQSFTTDPTYIPAASKLPRWWYPWSEPVRIKLALRTANQTAFFAPSLVIPTPPFVTLIEPIEPMVFFERFFIYDPQTAPVFAQSVVTATMFAVETNNDSADFEIVVRHKAHRAHVSIKEIRIGDDAYASIEET